ncbi:OsmC family peroxiredoxin (plasmid) [Lichenicola cladoniae]|uniref:OsmC family peroxiredoxin n=1 Tax=Lichenicola cladoniae TaxID=1484109 RepID=A0A6M8HYA8_9PROT|nr:OsmC family peroxiredoxin [Lichenicola cladoniae]NPD70037.1 OsmC family peroxiredoxin [Acetobacteraceae bacterium]QKE93392.1 OsmC family peroxiredoxin [Lichenicola cladoniae]
MMNATGLSTWTGTWKDGSGTISTKTDTLRNAPYSFSSRFSGTPGASPEELLAAAHAGCFNQALANNFGMIGLAADAVETAVTVEMGKDEEGHPAITQLFVTVEAKVPGITQAQFEMCAERARTRCSIAKALRCEIGMSATLG